MNQFQFALVMAIIWLVNLVIAVVWLTLPTYRVRTVYLYVAVSVVGVSYTVLKLYRLQNS